MSENGEKSKDTMLQPGQTIRPVMTVKTAKRLVENLYGLKVLSIEELVSYDDKNYKVKVDAGENSNPNIKEDSPHGYTLKVLNSMDSMKKHIDAEHEVQSKLKSAGVPCPRPVPDIEGRDKSLQKIYHEHDDDTEITSGTRENNNEEKPYGNHMVRLQAFIPGKTIVNVKYTPELLIEVGQTAAKIDQALLGYSHPALTSYDTIWNIIQTPRLREFIYAVKEESRKDLVNEVLQAFDQVVLPLINDCQKGVIHGDYNEQNILVDKIGTKNGEDEYHISGVIDYADMTDSYYVFEAAIAITYMSLDSSIIDPLKVGGYILSGYIPVMPLNNSEWNVLKECICARFCTSLVMGAYSSLMDPGNEYLLTTAKKGWSALRRFWETPKRELYEQWQAIIRELDPSIQVPNIEDVI